LARGGLTPPELAAKLPYVYPISRNDLLVLRLSRTGRRNQPKFRLVAAEQGKKLDGRVVEILGHYEPAAQEKPFVFDKEKVQGWLSKGAVVSNTVAKLLNSQGFDLPVHIRPERAPRKKAAPASIQAPSAVASGETAADKVGEALVAEPAPVSEETNSGEEAPAEAATETNEESAPVSDETVADESVEAPAGTPTEEPATEGAEPSAAPAEESSQE